MEGLGQAWESLQGNPFLLVLGGVLALFLVVGIVKRVLTIAVLSGALLMMYFIYVVNFQERFPMDWERLQEGWVPANGESNATSYLAP